VAGIKSECNHMRRVLFLLSHTEKGGGEVVIYNLVKHLDRTCFEPFVGHVDFRRGDFIHEFTNLRVTPVDFRAGHLRNPLATAGVVWRIGRFIRRNRVDVVFTSGAHNHIYAALAKRIVRVPIVTYIMNYYQPRLRDNPSIMRLALRLGADYYVVDSNSCMEPLRQLIPKDAPSEVVYHGVDEAFISGPSNPAWVRAQLGISSSQRLISVIGRLQRWKGQDIFLRAAATVSRTCPEARFAVVGGALFGLEEDYREELQRLIDELGLRGRCWLVGHQANIQDWMAASDIVVHASRESEPGANVVMEAMAMGLPAVGSRWSGNLSFMHDGNSWLLDGLVVAVPSSAQGHTPLYRGQRWFEPDRDALVAALRDVAAAGVGARARAAGARAELLQRFGPEVVAERIAHLTGAALERWRWRSSRPVACVWRGGWGSSHSLAVVNDGVVGALEEDGQIVVRAAPGQACASLDLVGVAQQQERSQVPDKYKWDLTQIYPNDQAWRAAKDALLAELPKVAAFKGTLGSSPQKLADFRHAHTFNVTIFPGYCDAGHRISPLVRCTLAPTMMGSAPHGVKPERRPPSAPADQAGAIPSAWGTPTASGSLVGLGRGRAPSH